MIVATTSYAGMGPYVSEIVNYFEPNDDVLYFFCEYEDNFFFKNVKKVLHSKSVFFRCPNNLIYKIRELLPLKVPYHTAVVQFCKKNAIDVVHFINNPAPRCLIKELAKIGIVCVSTVHDLHPHEIKKAWFKELRFRILYAKLNDNFVYGKNFITNSKEQYEEIKRNFPEKNVFFHFFPSLVTKEILNGHEKVAEIEKDSLPYILFFGRIEEYKGISLLYNAFTKNSKLKKRYKLVIAGSGTLPFSRVADEENVVLVNRYIKDSEVADLYKNACVVVYPYISATQSGVLSLAFFYKVPVLASDVSFFKDIIFDSGAGVLFKCGSEVDLTEKLLNILSVDCKDIGNRERIFYDSHYDGHAIRCELMRIYQSLKV
ncbi:MAG: glycosyltransferase [archaeon]|nr:glycosyltransferase [archaeon]